MLDVSFTALSDRKVKPPAGAPDPGLGSTAVLLAEVRKGDAEAREQLLARYLPMLQRWARGRLPARARDLGDTDDLVQVSLLRALNNIDAFECRREGAFLAYLRRIVLNAVRDEVRRSMRQPGRAALSEELPAASPSLLDRTIGHQALEAYEAALASLPEEKQEAVILRIEFGMGYQEIAEAIGAPSANSARMTVARTLVQLSELLDDHR